MPRNNFFHTIANSKKKHVFKNYEFMIEKKNSDEDFQRDISHSEQLSSQMNHILVG